MKFERNLIDSVKQNDLGNIKYYLSDGLFFNGADINAISYFINNPDSQVTSSTYIYNNSAAFARTASADNKTSISYVNKEVLPDKKIYSGSALYNAVVNDYTDVATYLINNGANINEYSFDSNGILLYSIRNNNCSLVKELINKGAEINHKSSENGILYLASTSCASDIRAYEELPFANQLTSVINPFFNNHNFPKNLWNNSPLNEALTQRNVEIADYLIGHGADIKLVSLENLDYLNSLMGSINENISQY